VYIGLVIYGRAGHVTRRREVLIGGPALLHSERRLFLSPAAGKDAAAVDADASKISSGLSER